jgi:hypothetical protein
VQTVKKVLDSIGPEYIELRHGQFHRRDAEEWAREKEAQERHVENLFRMPDRQSRENYLQELACAEGLYRMQEVREAYITEWENRRAHHGIHAAYPGTPADHHGGEGRGPAS